MLLFHHLPKTAGTSMHTMLGSVLWAEHADQLIGDSDPNPEVVHSHRPYMQLVKDCPGRENITVLRDPVHRTFSYFRWLRSNNGNDALAARKFSLVKWIDAIEQGSTGGQPGFQSFCAEHECSPLTSWYSIFNRMTIQLGSTHLVGPRGSIEPNKFPPLEECFERACGNISSMYWFGFRETLSSDVDRLSSMLGRPLTLPWANAAAEVSPPLNPKDIARIREINEWDIKLYEFAKSL